MKIETEIRAIYALEETKEIIKYLPAHHNPIIADFLRRISDIIDDHCHICGDCSLCMFSEICSELNAVTFVFEQECDFMQRGD